MPLLGEEFDSEVSNLSTGIQVVFQGCIGMENFKGKELTFVTKWLQRRGRPCENLAAFFNVCLKTVVYVSYVTFRFQSLNSRIDCWSLSRKSRSLIAPFS